MLAVTHLTPVVGVDVHMIQTPAGVVLPIPHPHVGFVLDPAEYLSCLPEGVGSMVSIGMMAMGAASIVKLGMRSIGAAAVAAGAMAVSMAAGGGGGPIWVNGLMRSTAGTQTMHTPGLHFPIGGIFTGPDAPKPAGNGEAFLGSMTVRANGDPMAYAVLPALTCWFAGMLSLSHNSEHTKRGASSLPTSVMLPVPAGRPVLVGGPPVPSIAALAGMAMQAAHAHGMKKEPRFCKVSKAIQDRVGDGLWGKVVKKVAKWAFGEPVNGITGEVVVQQHDFTVPGRLPLVWDRYYAGHDAQPGAPGYGWQSPADIRFELFAHDDEIGGLVRFPDQWVCFDQLPADEGWAARIIEGVGGHALYRDGDGHFIVRSRDGHEYRFPLPGHWREQALAANPQRPLRLWPEQFNDLNGNAWRIGTGDAQGSLLFAEWSGDAPTGRTVQCKAGDVRGCLGAITLHDAQGHVWPLVRYRQRASGDLVAVHDALDEPYRFEYDAAHRIVRHTDRNGLSFYYSHQKHDDGRWRVDHAWGDGGLYDYRFEYDLTYRETHITDSLGGLTRLQCDERGLPVMLTNPLGGVSSYRYDGLGRTIEEVDPAGYRTRWEYDLCGSLIGHTLPDRSATRTEYDDELRPVAITDPEGGVWKQAWDSCGRLTEQTTPSGIVTEFGYDARGQLVQVRDAGQQVTTLTYDPLGYLTTLTDPVGRTTRLRHDAHGKLVERRSPGEEPAFYSWDARGRLTACTLPGARFVRCEYDAEDNLTQYTDEAGHVTRFGYYGQGRLASRTEADGSITRYRYDTEEQLVGVTNALGQTWHLNRDAAGRLIEEVGYDGRSRRYTYNPAGHLTQSIDPLGNVLAVTCDPLGRITRRTVEGGTENEEFAYNRRGQLTLARNGYATVERDFDADGRLTEETQQHADARGTLAYVYNAAGRLSDQKRTLQAADPTFGQTLAYTYDALGQPQSVQIDGHEPIRFTRDVAGRLARTQFTTHLEHGYEYDRAGRLSRHATRSAGHRDDETRFEYDISGNLTGRRDSRLGHDLFRYDPLGRIVEHTDPAGRLKHFFHDAHGDRFRVVRDDEHGRQLQHADGGVWQLDAAGQLVTRQGREHGVQAFEWDAFGRMVRFENTRNERWAYQYDALGRRIGKLALDVRRPGATHSQQGSQTWFLWDGDAMAGEVRRQVAHGPLSAHFYAYHLGSFAPLALQADDGVSKQLYFYQTDPNGAPVRLRDADGGIVWEAHYAVTGRVDHVETHRIEQPIRLAGQYFDDESGLHYNRHRYFDPNTGSFISQDPIGLEGGQNPYQFAPNIIGWVDPLGLKCGPDAPLDWSGFDPAGLSRKEHVKLHGADDVTKDLHGIFSENPMHMVQQAWKKAKDMGITPTSPGRRETYTIPFPNAGTQGGKLGSGATLNTIKIVVEKGTNKVVTAFPE
ncbi:RHS repeat-associated core domain-containing protein [Paraburkholderia sabiae]|uniref:RHS repeat-associated core domain-containing protein n=2 Tax=Paraburkholderia sabiae TaxID=273251 RepID=A0ABU9QN57_9BURK|nr:RHS repeat-associated core domain-containing protein [Paraburkholderia sabiae]WJZ74909.1 RHS repeat-associated core domain-containing protein [Paraburkholderia sabiae]